ncbi:hypothetical protein JYU34_018963 [Plutella xylostella]|uniref:Uncharacterized protein n=1 Tax=Plutella xylostella TaxID=51655 RepID=A0ABQ7PZ65_PLUXY|nr:hypothetical protein JYU34_018963 [Plutella xylostella]
MFVSGLLVFSLDLFALKLDVYDFILFWVCAVGVVLGNVLFFFDNGSFTLPLEKLAEVSRASAFWRGGDGLKISGRFLLPCSIIISFPLLITALFPFSTSFCKFNFTVFRFCISFLVKSCLM